MIVPKQSITIVTMVILVIGGLATLSLPQELDYTYDGTAMPIKGLDPADYHGVPTNPVKNYTYSTVWTGNYNFGSEGTGRHSGVDIPMPKGTEIVACASGLVVRSDYSSSWGNVIVIWHDIWWGEPIFSCYAHLDQPLVSAGDHVFRGEVIGASGNTGAAFGDGGGYHLHFQIDKDKGGTHPYSFGNANLPPNDEISQWTHNPIPFIRDNPPVDVSTLVQPLARIEIGRKYTGQITAPDIALYAAPLSSDNTYGFDLVSGVGNPNLIHISGSDIQVATNFYLDEFFTYFVGQSGIDPVIVWSSTQTSTYELSVSELPRTLSRVKQAPLGSAISSKRMVKPLSRRELPNIASVALGRNLIGKVSNPNVARLILEVKEGVHYLVSAGTHGSLGTLLGLFEDSVAKPGDGQDLNIEFTAEKNGFVPLIISVNDGGDNYYVLRADEIADLTPPSVVSCNATTQSITVTLSEAVNREDATSLDSYQLIQRKGRRAIAMPIPQDIKISYDQNAPSITLFGVRLGRLKTYTISLGNIRDLHGNRMAGNNTCSFRARLFQK